MNKTAQHIIQVTGILMLLVFINFTVIIPCLNVSGNSITISEMVEEDEQEQEVRESNLHESMFHSLLASSIKKINVKERIEPIHHREVLTPPPKGNV